MSFHNHICPTVEAALVAYIKAQNPTNIPAANVFTGLGWGPNSEDPLDQDQRKVSSPLPNVRCVCEEAEQWIAPGNWKVMARIRVRSNADETTKDVHRARAGEIFSYFYVGNPGESVTLANLLSATMDDFTAQMAVRGNERESREDRSWVTELDLELYCAGSDFA